MFNSVFCTLFFVLKLWIVIFYYLIFFLLLFWLHLHILCPAFAGAAHTRPLLKKRGKTLNKLRIADNYTCHDFAVFLLTIAMEK